MLLKYGWAFQSSAFENRRCTSSPSYRPGGRPMECSTTRSITAPGGRGPKFGDPSRRAKLYQPACHSAGASGRLVIGFVTGRSGYGQPGDPVADLPQAQAQPLRRGGAVEAALVQSLDQYFTLLL